MKIDPKDAKKIVDISLARVARGDVQKEKYRNIVILLLIIASLLALPFLFKRGDYAPKISGVAIPISSKKSDGKIQVIINQDKTGHYRFVGKINGKQVVFLLDTGASLVAIPKKLAIYLELVPGQTVQAKTANGMSTSRLTRINKLEVGGITSLGVLGGIADGMGGDEILLGMSFLKKLEIQQKAGKITLIK